MSTNAQACHVGCSICWCCPASLGFPWLHSSATACRQHKCSSVSCWLFNLLMLSGFTRLPSASLKCNMWRWLLALPELCARIQARGKSPDRSRLTRDSERLTHSRLTARRMRPPLRSATLPELLMSYATRRTHKESRAPPRRLEVPRSSLKSPESDHQDARPPTSMSRQTGIARASETSASASQPR